MFYHRHYLRWYLLTIHDGKGQKDRTVPILETQMDELKEQLGRVITLHEQDCRTGYEELVYGGE